MKTLEASGKNVDEAIQNGLIQMGLTKDQVDVVVFDEGSRGFFGFGAKPARVFLTEKLKSMQRSAAPAKEEPRKAEPVKESAPVEFKAEKKIEKPAEKAPVKAEQPAVEKPAKPQENSEKPQRAERPERPQRANNNQQKPRAPKAVKEDKPVEKTEKIEKAEKAEQQKAAPMKSLSIATSATAHVGESTEASRDASRFLAGMLEKMGVDITLDAVQNEDGIFINASGEDAGTLIGYRGETLDALQYLVSLKVNKGEDEYQRVTLDAENYRAKREETLVKLANRLAAKAVKTGRKVSLEPMNPYERRILHSALQNNANVKTHSEGDEPYRRVVIVPKQAAGEEGSPAPRQRNSRPPRRRHSDHRRSAENRTQENAEAPAQESASQE